MKNLVILALVLCSINTFAQQPQKGSILIGGDITGAIEKDTYKDDVTGTTFETNVLFFGLSPRAGITLFDGFMVGGILNLATGRSKFGGDKSTASQFQIGPFVRYYLPAKIFAEFNFTGGFQSSKLTQGGVSAGRDTDTILSGFLGAGYAYFLNSSVSLEPLVGLGYDRVKFENDDTNTTFGARLRISLVVYLKNE